MKLITAIIPPERLESTKVELGKVNVYRLTVMDCQGISKTQQEPSSKQSAAAAYGQQNQTVSFVKIMIAVNEEFLEPSIHAILRGAEIKEQCDDFGRIFISSLEEVIRIRTGERGPGAI